MRAPNHTPIALTILALAGLSGTAIAKTGGSSLQIDVLPLKAGMYVSSGQDCRFPANAGIRWYDGKGLNGSATHDCRSKIVKRLGNAYVIDQNCIVAPSGGGPRSSERQIITVHSPRHFSLKIGRDSTEYGYCEPSGNLGSPGQAVR
jgi:hypothetical protein